ncbi:heme exporter protein CcmD [Stenotrophomonas maltophilia]|nr:heme exporter protein CcmD [Stenotrophomonas maltophilia]
MTHLPYVIGAYAVFVLVLAADAIGSWLRLRVARRLALARQQRQQPRAVKQDAAAPRSTELER